LAHYYRAHRYPKSGENFVEVSKFAFLQLENKKNHEQVCPPKLPGELFVLVLAGKACILASKKAKSFAKYLQNMTCVYKL